MQHSNQRQVVFIAYSFSSQAIKPIIFPDYLDLFSSNDHFIISIRFASCGLINFSMLICLTRKMCFTLSPFIAQATSDLLVLIDIFLILMLQSFFFFFSMLLDAACTLVKV